MDYSSKLSKILDHYKLNKNSFSKEIGLTNNVTIGRIINENRKPSDRTMTLIFNRFKEINQDWFLNDIGNMIREIEFQSEGKRLIWLEKEKGEIHPYLKEYIKVKEALKDLEKALYTHQEKSPQTREQLDDIMDRMTDMSYLDFSGEDLPTSVPPVNHFDFVNTGLNQMKYHLGKSFNEIKKYQYTLNSINIPIITTKLCGEVDFLNECFLSLYGEDSSELLGNSIKEILSSKDGKLSKFSLKVIGENMHNIPTNSGKDYAVTLEITPSFSKDENGNKIGCTYHINAVNNMQQALLLDGYSKIIRMLKSDLENTSKSIKKQDEMFSEVKNGTIKMQKINLLAKIWKEINEAD